MKFRVILDVSPDLRGEPSMERILADWFGALCGSENESINGDDISYFTIDDFDIEEIR